MSFFKRDEFLSKASIRISGLENKLSIALSKIDSLVFTNRELQSKVEKLTQENEALKIINKSLTDKVSQLEKRLKINSSNSNMSSSSNRFIRHTVSGREPSDKKSGGQSDAKNFVKIRGFISTMKKHGQNIIDAIGKVIRDPSDYDFQMSG